jgi:HlyD family type I secretion membrane fusion protein
MTDTTQTPREALIQQLTGPAAKSRMTWRWILTGLFVFGLILMSFVPLASGVPAMGLLHPTKPRQILQHPTGGVIKQILVKDGQAVTAGQVLVKLDDAQERAAYSVTKFQALALRAELAVRQAEVQGLSEPVFPPDLLEMAARETDVRGILDSQIGAFQARKRNNANQAAQIRQQIVKNSRSAAQAQARATAASRQLALVREESDSMRTLLEKGLTLKSRVLALDRAQASLGGEAAAFSAEVQRLNAENVELSRRLEQPELAARVQASEAMRTVMNDLGAAQDRFMAARAALERTVMRAPMAGKVISSRTTTIGGVVRPGEPVMEIVPEDGEFQLKARIKLADADNIEIGNEVTIRFDMVQGTAAPTITGTVTNISADVVEDPRTGESFYEAKIAIPPSEARRVPENVMAPGRPAEVLIKTGERTLLSYFMLPLQRAQFKALREE